MRIKVATADHTHPATMRSPAHLLTALVSLALLATRDARYSQPGRTGLRAQRAQQAHHRHPATTVPAAHTDYRREGPADHEHGAQGVRSGVPPSFPREPQQRRTQRRRRRNRRARR
ncbi:unnamed protein product [Leptidea sinapis]|uniref:Secreted protein n=1 Tax=Leptidea sinapis TaxID=189913 RepID=A0A5E4Q8W9_9NEOP|nr:unnamed protein product [Leptidea sinapis]